MNFIFSKNVPSYPSKTKIKKLNYRQLKKQNLLNLYLNVALDVDLSNYDYSILIKNFLASIEEGKLDCLIQYDKSSLSLIEKRKKILNEYLNDLSKIKEDKLKDFLFYDLISETIYCAMDENKNFNFAFGFATLKESKLEMNDSFIKETSNSSFFECQISVSYKKHPLSSFEECKKEYGKQLNKTIKKINESLGLLESNNQKIVQETKFVEVSSDWNEEYYTDLDFLSTHEFKKTCSYNKLQRIY